MVHLVSANRLAAERLYELEGGLGAGLLDGRLGDLAGLDRHVDADLGIGVAVKAFDAVGPGIEPGDDAGLGIVGGSSGGRRIGLPRPTGCRIRPLLSGTELRLSGRGGGKLQPRRC